MKHSSRILLAAALLALSGLATGIWLLRPAPAALPHDAYIWQRQWNEPLREAIAESRAQIRSWRVLLAQADQTGVFRNASLEAPPLAASGRPVIGVIRIEGQIANFDESRLVAGIRATLDAARDKGLRLAGVEIDHDCASAKLPRYAAFLARLRAELPAARPLAITALPAWLDAPGLPAVLAQTDEAVLQVHAVSNPQSGLFEPRRALGWVERFSRLSPVPFRVALPAYGSQLRFDAFGNLAGVESEMPLLGAAGRREEMIVAPRDVQRLLRELQAHPPARLTGFAWFRLPTGEDRRSWQPATWRAVLRDETLAEAVTLSARTSADPQLFDLVVHNPATTDVPLPARITLPAACTLADGTNGYAFLAGTQDKPALLRAQSGLLRPGHELVIGWARCPYNPESDLHAQPQP
ncbi:DUF3142 domain-containing protein [Uliginosibacterium sp. 31-16]|uniref:DUF3142 domain-containing protein n=1 Tax=Uliginosibacterium sp. 31-16 TaxID=3068315 RepID=UPI00273DD3DE|nr:DUF3142 domain-containing protein [Uliginosibacterium sp. 31-16]MDP5240427.1 DUF3142 domain-containing protein [Uliginosibacterium sp. 31-16]